jgi:hypothetical protein
MQGLHFLFFLPYHLFHGVFWNWDNCTCLSIFIGRFIHGAPLLWRKETTPLNELVRQAYLMANGQETLATTLYNKQE